MPIADGPARRLRLALIVIGGLLLTVLIVAAIAVYLLLQPDRFTAMLQDQARNAGLELNLSSPASPSLFPRPALDLYGITLSAPGATAPILLAARGRLALPWRTLFGGPTVITRLEIDSPRVDLVPLQDWLAAMPAHPAGVPLNIPRIDTGMSIVGGSVVRGDEALLDDVSLAAGSLMSGQPFPLTLDARTSAGTAIELRLSATPRIEGNALQLEGISLHLSEGGNTTLALNGSAHWHGFADASADLTGKLEHADAGQYDISVHLTPADQTDPLLLALKLDGPDNHADVRLPPLALAHWWSQLNDPQRPRLGMPPGDGQIDIGQWQAGNIGIEGLSIQTGAAVPAPSSSTPTASPTIPAKTATR
jgi:hypothetical protein